MNSAIIYTWICLIAGWIVLANQLDWVLDNVPDVVIIISFYLFFFITVSALLRLILGRIWVKSNWRVSLWTLFIILIIFELALRSVGLNLTAHELNGMQKYRSHFPTSNKILQQNSGDSCQYQNSEFSYWHYYNKHGIRDIDYRQEELDTSYTILSIGDSFTEGYGVPQDSTWPSLLNNRLQEQETGIICINAGQTNSDPAFDFYRLKHVLFNIYKPDLVILTINMSDIDDIMQRGGMERFNTDTPYTNAFGPSWEWFYGLSHLTRFLLHQVFNFNYLLLSPKQYKKALENSLQIIGNELPRNFSNLANELGFEFKLVLIPWWIELQYPQPSPINKIQNVISKQDFDSIQVLNLYDKYKDLSIEQLKSMYWVNDIHHNSYGNQLLANYIFEFIQE